MTRWLVLPSPFLGAQAYRPFVDELRSLGHEASVAPYDEPPVAAALVEAWAAEAAARSDVVLVPHSNAGFLAPAVSDAVGGLPVVFVDAALPGGAGTTRLAPTAFRDHLATLAAPDGRLPRWTRWWPRDDLAITLPNAWFDRLDASVPEVPLSYVDGEVPVPDGWAAGRCGYLAFGSTYDEEWVGAERHGWPRRRLDGAGHLHLILEPAETAAAVVDLASRISSRRR